MVHYSPYSIIQGSRYEKMMNTRASTSYHRTQRNTIEERSTSIICDNSTRDTNRVGPFALSTTLSGIGQGTTLALRQSWWCFPMVLLLIPIIYLMNGTWVQTPNWWTMTNLKYLQSSKVGMMICAGFLSSNIFYFLSGFYLLNVKPLAATTKRRTVKRRRKNMHDDVECKTNEAMEDIHSRGWDPILGWLVLCSGGMSLIYHSFQALGPLNIAESLCYFDHGLAISSFFCFLDKCGLPSPKTWIIGLLSLTLLVVSGDVYPIVHSLWHLGSASTTVSWASDAARKRRDVVTNI